MLDLILLCSVAATICGRTAGAASSATQDKGSLATLQLQGLPTIDLSGLTTWQNSLQQLNGFGILNIGTDSKRIVFTLRNQNGNYADKVLDIDSPITLSQSGWDNSQDVKIVIHGYMEDSTGGPLSLTKIVYNEYTNVRRPENLVFVDWSNLARQLNYFDSVSNVELVGKRLAQFLVLLRNSTLITDLAKVHIVGFSLGAHIAAVGSYLIKPIIKETLGRITGLDPAGPGFMAVPLAKRLDPTDADFVDVIHTNGGTSLFNQFKYFGYPYELGHVDFYPNGGAIQPTCTFPVFGEIVGVCSHSKAAEYFASTILGRKYIGCPCLNWATYKKGLCACTNGPITGEFVDKSHSCLTLYVTVGVSNRYYEWKWK